jgi:hypothetical protein
VNEGRSEPRASAGSDRRPLFVAAPRIFGTTPVAWDEGADLGADCGGRSGPGEYVRSERGHELVGLIQEHVPGFDQVKVTALRSPRVLRVFTEID